jgi:hypothetical protein
MHHLRTPICKTVNEGKRVAAVPVAIEMARAERIHCDEHHLKKPRPNELAAGR